MHLDRIPPLELSIPPEWEGRSIEAVLRSELHFSRSRIRRLKRDAQVLRNGSPTPLWERLRSGDMLHVEIPMVEQAIPGDPIPLKIIFEDDDLVVIDKPAGLVVHPSKGHPRETLANALIYHWTTHQIAAGFHPVHRLDRWTSGLILIAKSPWAHQQLDRQLQSRRLVREYLAVVSGKLPSPSGVIEAPIALAEDGHHRTTGLSGQRAATRFRAIRRWQDVTWVLCRLKTGRTHQIRVHFSHIGHPLIGDSFYGGADTQLHRPALHSYRLRFLHPRHGNLLRFAAPLPEDIAALWIKPDIASADITPS